MNQHETSLSIRRILVALDASPHSLAALDAAVDLAARMKAELSGVFVEDVDLLRLADAPKAQEIAYPAARGTPLTRAIMERRLRAQSEQIRDALRAAAHRARVRWSFRTVRGRVTSALREAAGENDILAIGRLGWSMGPRLRIGSTAFELATSRVPLLLTSRRGGLAGLRLLVYYDGSPASKKALLVAAHLAKSGAKGITIFVSKANHIKHAEIGQALEGQSLQIRYRSVDPEKPVSLLRAVKEEEPGMLVLANRQLKEQPAAFEALLREVELQLFLFSNGLAPK